MYIKGKKIAQIKMNKGFDNEAIERGGPFDTEGKCFCCDASFSYEYKVRAYSSDWGDPEFDEICICDNCVIGDGFYFDEDDLNKERYDKRNV